MLLVHFAILNASEASRGRVDDLREILNIDDSVEPVYIEKKGWNVDTTKITSESEFPKELVDYIAYLEAELETPISIVSVGPDRSQTIQRNKVMA